jgi:hypothetical protein
MKLRIKGDSLRLRLGPQEIARLIETGRVEETIHFGAEPGASLTYALELAPAGRELTLRYAPRRVTVLVLRERANEWARGNVVGIAGEVAAGENTLTVLVEKDFACIDREDHENEDTFPNPKAGVC